VKESLFAEMSNLFGEYDVGLLGMNPSPYWEVLVLVNLCGVVATSCIGARHYLYPSEGGRRDVLKAIIAAVDLDTPYFIATQGVPYVLGHETADIPAMRQRNAYFRGMPTAMIGLFVAFRDIVAFRMDGASLRMAMKFNASYANNAEIEFKRSLFPHRMHTSNPDVAHAASQFCSEVGDLERWPHTLTEARSETEFFDLTMAWGCAPEDVTVFNGYAAFVMAARKSVLADAAWKVVRDSPSATVAVNYAGISNPTSLDSYLSGRSRQGIRQEFKEGQGGRNAEQIFVLDFDGRSLWWDLAWASFQLLTASKALAEQTPNFRSVSLLRRCSVYLHILFDGVLVLACCCAALLFIQSSAAVMGSWISCNQYLMIRSLITLG